MIVYLDPYTSTLYNCMYIRWSNSSSIILLLLVLLFLFILDSYWLKQTTQVQIQNTNIVTPHKRTERIRSRNVWSRSHQNHTRHTYTHTRTHCILKQNKAHKHQLN